MNFNLKTLFLLFILCFSIFSYGQPKAVFFRGNKFEIPLNGKYSILIVNLNDTLYSYSSIFNISFKKNSTGIYMEFEKNIIRFEGYLQEGKLNGLYRKYNSSGLLIHYGKYLNDIMIEKSEIIYDNKKNIIKIEVDTTHKRVLRK